MKTFKCIRIIVMAVMFFSAAVCSNAHDIASVVTYGANGSDTISDTTAFNNAITALGPNGGYLFIPHGVYYINNVTVSQNITLCGDTQGGTILKANGSGQVLSIGGSNVTIQDLTIDGGEDQAYSNNGIVNSSGKAMAVKNVNFQNCSGYALYLQLAYQAEISNSTFHGGTAGMLYADASSGLFVRGCIFEAKTVPFAIKLTATTNAHSATISNNWFEFNANAGVTDTIIADAQEVSILNNKFSVTSDTAQHLSHIRVKSHGDRTLIIGNNFQQCGSGAKNLIIETGAKTTYACGNRDLNSNVTDSGTSSFLMETNSTLDSNLIYQKNLLLQNPGATGANIGFDAVNSKITVFGAGYFGVYSYGYAELGANSQLHLKANSGAINLKSDSNTIIEKANATSGNWQTGHLVLCGKHLWVDSTGKLRINSAAPASDTDGIIVGQQ